jgi:tRNA 2-thiouridine synthesizing protein A
MTEISTDRELNCRGMSCPLPVMYTRKALAGMETGQVLMVITTDPGSIVDIPAFSRRSQTELMAHREDGGDYIFFLRKT